MPCKEEPPEESGEPRVKVWTVLAPWTQSLSLRWRPELSFYERRVDILKAFEEQGILRAFRVEEGKVDAQLFDSRDRLTVKQDGLDLQLLTPDAEPDRALQAVKRALREVGPKNPWQVSGSFQHITEIALAFDEAVGRAHGRVIGELNAGALKFGDWAVLVDLAFGEPPAAGRVEYGIIRAQEAPRRLARIAGRAGSAEGREHALKGWESHTFPDVSIFSDGAAARSLEGKEGDLAAVAAEFWVSARNELASISESLHAILVADDARRVESG